MTGLRILGVRDQSRDRQQVALDPPRQVLIRHDDREIVQDIGEIAVGVLGQIGILDRGGACEHEEQPGGRGRRRRDEPEHDPGLGAVQTGGSTGGRRTGIGPVVNTDAGRDVGGEGAQGVGGVLEGAGARRQRRGGVDRIGAQGLEARRRALPGLGGPTAGGKARVAEAGVAHGVRPGESAGGGSPARPGAAVLGALGVRGGSARGPVVRLGGGDGGPRLGLGVEDVRAGVIEVSGGVGERCGELGEGVGVDRIGASRHDGGDPGGDSGPGQCGRSVPVARGRRIDVGTLRCWVALAARHRVAQGQLGERVPAVLDGLVGGEEGLSRVFADVRLLRRGRWGCRCGAHPTAPHWSLALSRAVMALEAVSRSGSRPASRT